ncbi:hypothetical protein NliqN6_3477 [Naganishia liquefaciens]|uniref:Uncharacterized protein n=1 Tax=Naganishia liquefaciens TaxID=104408 RepID=A0A8H3TUR4_9TREE|nr:hypothetical protein NliqN6_3477 [Naganishia liquefaciens]
MDARMRIQVKWSKISQCRLEENAKHFEDRRRIMGTDGVLQIARVVCCNDDGESLDVWPENAEIVAYLPTESESVHNGVF